MQLREFSEMGPLMVILDGHKYISSERNATTKI